MKWRVTTILQNIVYDFFMLYYWFSKILSFIFAGFLHFCRKRILLHTIGTALIMSVFAACYEDINA
jgi:hypothetical protein